MELQWRRAVVVGASSGIGEALARELAAGGAAVVLVARRKAELEKLAEELRGRGATAHVLVHDASKYDEAPALLEQATQLLGGLDLLVYAAGVLLRVDEGEYSFAKDRQMVEVNLLGAMAWMDPAAARFEAARAGTLLGISSVAGERGRREVAAYAASKAGFTCYLESLRNRCSRYGVNVVTVKPGFVDTAMVRGRPGLFWVISPADAARRSLRLAARGSSASGFVPRRWALVMAVVRALPGFIMQRLNF